MGLRDVVNPTAELFDAIVRSSVKLCDGLFGAVFLLRDGLVHLVAHDNVPPETLDAVREHFPATPTLEVAAGRLDRFAAEALAEVDRGETKEL